MDNLRYIRETMERASAFTGISGWGQVAIGVTALGTTLVAALQVTQRAWLTVWLAEAVISLLIAGWSMDRKARAALTAAVLRTGSQSGFQLVAAVGRRSARHCGHLFRARLTSAIPGVWLLALRHRRDHLAACSRCRSCPSWVYVL